MLVLHAAIASLPLDCFIIRCSASPSGRRLCEALTFISQTDISSWYGAKVSREEIVVASNAIVSRVTASFMFGRVEIEKIFCGS